MNNHNPNCYLLSGSQDLKREDAHPSLIYSSLLGGWVIPLKCPEIMELLSQYSKYRAMNQYEPLFDETKPFKHLSFDQLLMMPPKQWLVKDIFGIQDVGMIFGPSGCGKTFVVIDFIIKMCTGKRWAHRFDVSRPLSVAYCAGEGFGGLASRFKAAAAYHRIERLPNFTFMKSVPQLFNPQSEYSMAQFIHQWHETQKPLDILIIDTMHNAISGADENSSKDADVIMSSCQLAAQSLGCAVLLIHHTNKKDLDERGSGAFRGNCDFMIHIAKPKHGRTETCMSCSKVKDGEYWTSQNFNLNKIEEYESVHVSWDTISSDEEVDIAADFHKKKILETLAQYPSTKFTARGISEAIGKDVKYTSMLLYQLRNDDLTIFSYQFPDQPKSKLNPWVYSHKKLDV